MATLELPIVSPEASVDDVMTKMHEWGASAAIVRESGQYFLIKTADLVTDSVLENASQLGQVRRRLMRVLTEHLDVASGVADNEIVIATINIDRVSVAGTPEWLTLFSAIPRRCACSNPDERHPHNQDEEGQYCWCGALIVCKN